MTVAERSAGSAIDPIGAEPSLDLLRSQVERVWNRSPFYAERWRAAGLRDGELPETLADYGDRWPTVDKSDILADQQDHPPYGRNLVADRSDLAQVHLTSNTTGIGREVYGLTARDVEAMGASWTPQFDAIGIARGDVVIATLPVSFMTAGLSAMEGIRHHGLVGIATGLVDKGWIIDAMERYEPALMYGSESFILQVLHLIEDSGAVGRMPRSFKGVIAPGVSPKLIEMAERILGCPTYEVYGSTQASTRIATTCAAGVTSGSLHLHAGNHLVEIVNDAGEPAQPGESGEVILTTLRREASPALRFRMNDRVRLRPDACPCGATGPAIEPMSVGRVDDMVKVKGVNIWPQTMHRVVMAVPEILEYQVEVRRRSDGGEQLCLIVECSDVRPDVLAQLEAAVRAATYVRPVIEVADALPRHDYKARRWADLRT